MKSSVKVLFSAIVMSQSLISSAGAVCICDNYPEGWVCRPAGCWIDEKEQSMGERRFPEQVTPRIDPGLINPERRIINDEKFDRKRIPADKFDRKVIPADKFDRKVIPADKFDR